MTPTDPLYTNGSQAWLGLLGRLGGTNYLGLERIWDDYRGQGVRVGVWDDGVQSNHPDLSTNYNPTLHVSLPGVGTNNGQPISLTNPSPNGHGTAVGGVIAADNNGVGGVGVAFDARVTGVTMFGGSFDINSSMQTTSARSTVCAILTSRTTATVSRRQLRILAPPQADASRASTIVS